MLNEVRLIGRIGSDPKVRYTKSGKAVAGISVATNNYWIDANGEKQEEVEWHKVTLWGKNAEFAGSYLKKGSLIHVTGSLKTDKYTDADDIERYMTKVRAFKVLALEKIDKSDKTFSKDEQMSPTQDMDENDIPF